MDADALSTKQTQKLLKLSAIPVAELSDKQLAKLESLLLLKSTHLATQKRQKLSHDNVRPPPPSASISAAPNAATKAFKCDDQGHWGDDGSWVYPTDLSITCTTCKAAFTFTGAEQAWYAKKELYAPSRCAACISAKKEAKAEKLSTGRSGANHCFNCGRAGHLSTECPEPRAEKSADGRKSCYVCGSDAHLSRNCPNARSKKKAAGCFTCGSTGHLSRECPEKPAPICFNCGEAGHASKSCEMPVRTSGVCYAFQKGQCHRRQCAFTH